MLLWTSATFVLYPYYSTKRFGLTSYILDFAFNLTLQSERTWAQNHFHFKRTGKNIDTFLFLICWFSLDSTSLFSSVFACCLDFVLLCTPLPSVWSVWASSVCRGSVMLSEPLSERFSSVLRLTNVGPLSETHFTPFEVLTPSSAASPTLLTRRLFDMKSMLVHFGEFYCLFLLRLGRSFHHIRLFWGGVTSKRV